MKSEKDKAKALLKTLSIFAFSERKSAKQSISELDVQIEKVEHQLNDAQQNFDKENGKLKDWERNRKKQITAELQNDYPIPSEPERLSVVLDDGTIVTDKHFNNEFVIDCIIDAMKSGICYNRNDLLEIVSEFKKVNDKYMQLYQIAWLNEDILKKSYMRVKHTSN
ncbi:MAG: hypothetical protein IJA55_10640 [Clostridia bacterium]|nr:hypothetical protein [Clostridia bacterium]